MKAVVVYESLWGNTAAIARAIAEGLGPEAVALHTDEATSEAVRGADLIVAGAPVLGFSLPTDEMRDSIRSNPGNPPAPPDLAHPPLRSWLGSLPAGTGRFAAFETRLRGPFPGGAVKQIAKGFEGAGYTEVAKPSPFYVAGKWGPLRDGEVDRARAWGAALAESMD
jgi:flavodoxin